MILRLLAGMLIAFNVYALDTYNLAYFGEDATFEAKLGTPVSITLYFAENDEDLQAQWRYFNDGAEVKDVRGFALVKDNTCIILVNKFEKWDDRSSMAVLGHEVLHCFGADHDAPIPLPSGTIISE